MNHKVLAAVLLLSIVALSVSLDGEETSPESTSELETATFPPPTTMVEARSRARLLHETIRGTLQVVHRDFFDEDNAHAIPSSSMEDVFAELSRGYNVQVKWLIVETDVVNIDHKPEGEFEHTAVKVLKSGKPMHEAIEGNRYRYAGPIRLQSQCLKCHVRNRKSTEDRTAGLSISMPTKFSQ